MLNKGSSVKLAAPSGKKIHAHSKKIFDVTDLGDQILIRGSHEGDTFISIGSDVTPLVVLEPNKFAFYEKLLTIIKTMEGLTLIPSSKALSIEGELLQTSDWELIAKLKIPSEFIRFNATIHPLIKKDVHSLFRRLLLQNHLPSSSLNIEGVPQAVVSVGSKDIQTLLRQVLGPYGILVSASDSEIETAPMVRTKVVVASINRSHLLDLGIKWPSSYSAQLLPKTLGTQDSVNIDFSFLETNGWGKVLASPTLLCRSGKEASFLSGGEFPIRIINIRTKDITWKKYGVQVKLKPLADYSGKMSINLETEVSSLDQDNSIEKIPALQTNRISSHFDLTASRTIALSGLIFSESGNKREGLPILSKVPLIGRLFGADNFRERQSELVIFVTPEIVLPDNNQQEDQLPSSWSQTDE